jgi:hypothetical protein
MSGLTAAPRRLTAASPGRLANWWEAKKAGRNSMSSDGDNLGGGVSAEDVCAAWELERKTFRIFPVQTAEGG